MYLITRTAGRGVRTRGTCRGQRLAQQAGSNRHSHAPPYISHSQQYFPESTPRPCSTPRPAAATAESYSCVQAEPCRAAVEKTIWKVNSSHCKDTDCTRSAHWWQLALNSLHRATGIYIAACEQSSCSASSRRRRQHHGQLRSPEVSRNG